MKQERQRASFSGKLVMLGFGSIGQAMLPLLQRELDIKPERLRIVKATEDGTGIAAKFGVEVHGDGAQRGQSSKPCSNPCWAKATSC